MSGPKIPIAIWADETKYRQEGETYEEKCGRIAGALTDNRRHFDKFHDILKNQRFLPGGRIQAGCGSTKKVTAFNCFVMQKVPDDLMGIMKVATEAAKTMQLGGGVGYDFSAIRPSGDIIKSLGSVASGPISFMGIFDSVCKTIASAGHRRGAQMACMRVDHPDIMKFITAKGNNTTLTDFNMSVLITDAFMRAVKNDTTFDLVFNGKVYETVKARNLWDAILRHTWDWAEPGVIFIDRVNQMNNLWYIEDISATNPCGEQPLPPYGACLLGSSNLTAYIVVDRRDTHTEFWFDYEKFEQDIPHIVRAMDNVIDETTYPLPEQEVEAKAKRRMGLGITGLANTLTALGIRYGSDEAAQFLDRLMGIFVNAAYKASALLASEKGSFPEFDKELYLQSEYIKHLDKETIAFIREFGLRNSHLISIAPTGTISLTANNVSSGIEPVFSYSYLRKIQTANGPITEEVQDFAYREWGLKGETVNDISVLDHVKMLTAAQYWVDSAVSKTCNVGDHVTWEEFKEVYMTAFDNGAKGCTTFRAAGKRYGILTASKDEEVIDSKKSKDEVTVEGGACYIDLETGIRTCDA